MSDFQERLRAADPVKGGYDRLNTDAMVARIMAAAPRARRHVLRSFQLRMAGSVALAAALTIGGITALEGAGPSLAVFALAAPSASTSTGASSPSASSAAVPKSGVMRIYEEFNFTAGSSLSTSAGSGAAYALSMPASASAEAARLAGVFGVSGTPVDVNSDGQDFTATDPSGSFVEYQTYGAVPQWSYSTAAQADGTSSTTSDGATVTMPSHATVNADVQNLLSQLGYGYQVVKPEFSTSNNVVTSPGAPEVTTNEEQATYSITVDGQATDQYLSVTVDQNNTVVSADGPAFSAAPAVNYPLQSAADGVAALESQQQAYFTANNAVGVSGSGTATSSPASPPVTAPASGVPVTPSTIAANDTTVSTLPSVSSVPPIVDVTLDTATISYQTYQLTNGSVWMLPIYNYTGLVTNADGSSYTGTWSTIAVDPAYIQVSSSSSGGISPGGPILY